MDIVKSFDINCNQNYHNQIMQKDEFVFVKHRKKNKKWANKNMDDPQIIFIYKTLNQNKDLLLDKRFFTTRLRMTCENILSTKFWHHNFSLLSHSIHKISSVHKLISDEDKNFDINDHSKIQVLMILFGLGHFSTSIQSFHQLAFFSAIANYIEKASEKFDLLSIINYDPCYDYSEKQILIDNLRHTLIPDNNDCKFDISRYLSLNFTPYMPSDILENCLIIVYMPHCDMIHYENLLCGNYLNTLKVVVSNAVSNNLSKAILNKTILIGNSFASMSSKNISNHLKSLYPCIYALLREGSVEEIPLVNDYKIKDTEKSWDDIFNDTSLHLFSL
ncbi:unnamed protein product [Gordionus sp. m RMFG-2023]